MKKQLSKKLPGLLLSVFLLMLSIKVNAQAPTISDFSPKKGPIGTQVHITGTGFSLDPTKNMVFFGAVMARNIQVISSTQLVAEVAVGTDNGDLTITNLETNLTCSTDNSFNITYTSSGPLTFATSPTVIYLPKSYDIIPKDFDNDGKIDFLISTGGSNLIIERNNSTPGTLSFTTNQNSINPVVSDNNSMTTKVADFNGDGLLDIVTVTRALKKITIYTNTSNPSTPGISFSAADIPIGITGYFLETADIDHDGKTDLIIADVGTQDFTVMLNTSSSSAITFGKENNYQLAKANYTIYALKAADTENRGVFDIAIGANYGEVTIYRNTSTPGNIQLTPKSYPIPEYTSISKGLDFVDLTGEGLPEMIVLYNDNFVVKRNQGAGSFSASLNYPVTNKSLASLSISLEIEDANGDGKSDLILNNPSSGAAEIYINDFAATNSFLPPVSIPTATSQSKVFLSDADGDGKSDIIYGSGTSLPGSTSILLNTQIIPTELTTLPPTNISSAAVTLNATVKANTADVIVGFEVGTTPDLSTSFTFAATTNGTIMAGSGVKDVSYTLNDPGAPGIYYYRVVATNTNGEVSRGAILSFEIKTEISAITTISPNPNNGTTGSVVYKVDFSGVVNGLDAANFALTQTGGVTNATISNVIQNPVAGNLWQVTVALGKITDNGTIQLSLVNANNLSAPISTTLPFAGEVVTITPDVIATTLPATNITPTSATLNGAVRTNSSDVNVKYEFSTLADFSSKFAADATVNPVVTAGSGLTQTSFAFDNVTIPGTYYYRVVATANGKDTYGEIMSVQVDYAINAIKTASPNPNDGSTGLLLYEVEFNGVVNNLSAANLSLATTGTVNAAISTVVKSGNPAKPNSWFVTLTIAPGGNGTVQLSLANTTNLSSSISNALPVKGEIYTIEPPLLVITLPATNVSAGGVTLNGSVKTTLDGVYADILYGTKPDLSGGVLASSVAKDISKGIGFVDFSFDVKNLPPGKYYYAAVAQEKPNLPEIIGQIMSVDIPVSIVEIKPLIQGPLNSPKSGPLYRVKFSAPIDFLSTSNFTVTMTGGVFGVTVTGGIPDPNDPNSYLISLNVPLGGDGSLTLNLVDDGAWPYKVAEGLPFAGETLMVNGVPLAPQGLSANPGDALVKLDWTANSESDIWYYEIYRDTSPNPTTLIKSVPAGTFTYTDVNLTNGTKYYYRIAAIDNSDYISDYSTDASATPLPGLALKADQTITFAPLTDRVYGDADFDLTATASSGLQVTYTSSDNSIATVTGSTVHILHAGTVTISADQGGDNNAYNKAGQVSRVLTIAQKQIDVAADAKTKVFNTLDPVFTYTYTPNLVNGDTFGGNLSRIAGEAVGSYDITLGSLSLSNDYKINFTDAQLTITAAPVNNIAAPQGLTATAGDAQVQLTWNANSESDVASYEIYGGTSPNPTMLLTSVQKDVLTYTHPNLTNGTTYYYRITAKNTANAESTYSNEVSAKPVHLFFSQSIIFNAIPVKTYGDADFDVIATASSALPVGYSSSDNSIATVVNGKVHILKAGTVTIYADQIGDNQYSAAAQASQILTINKAAVTVSANAMTKNIGDADPALTYSLSSGKLIGTDSFSGQLDRVPGEGVGSYAIGLGSLTAGSNYTLSFVPSTLTISLKSIASFKLDANNILTPNGDGINDKLVIKGLGNYPAAKLTIVDREGRTVYQSENYQNDFDGMYKGSPLATDTYYYVLDFGKGMGKIKNFFTIVN
ncbi:MBG domain-containing protein [Pedobacter boryungensis]|uniref:VCBS repeat-containing protein n=1 Tax=Pedobacter boryungensis TaxID=869962 RepID=A0ABX2DJN7_9SPHI|nr:FG-GAP-like repeat-containing protein [Pedobacter boryungensis]NQX33146.1 VCBS repeat-containing protein [Pedobacter boryungensis]